MPPTTNFHELLGPRRLALRLLAAAALFAALHGLVAWRWPIDRAGDWTDAYRVTAFVRSLALTIAFVGFLRWLWRAHQNLRALQTTPPQHSLGWAIGGWFVPGLNFVRPYQVVREIWFASAAATGRTRKRAPLLMPWWIAWNIAVVFLIATAWAGTGDWWALTTIAGWAFVADLAVLAAALCSALVVGRITNWQESAWSNRADLPPPVAAD